MSETVFELTSLLSFYIRHIRVMRLPVATVRREEPELCSGGWDGLARTRGAESSIHFGGVAPTGPCASAKAATPTAERWVGPSATRGVSDERRHVARDLAEGVGFEPTDDLRHQRFSRPPP